MKIKTRFLKNLDEKILSVDVHKDLILIGGTSKYLQKVALNDDMILKFVKHERSIRSVTIYNEYFACASYDSKASVFKDDQLLDIIEGPDTEIKCIRISEEYIACSTRSGNIWIFDKYCEINSLINNNGDIKGVFWNNGKLFVYGYNNAIILYFKKGDTWEILQKLKQDTIIWDALLFDKMLVTCDNNGYLWIYRHENLFVLDKKIKVSIYPVFKMCCGSGYLFYICNRDVINILDNNYRLVYSISGQQVFGTFEGCKMDINCIAYCEESRLLVAGGDGLIVVYEIEF
ncbi:putative cytosolic Fe-S cluster assembly factor [Dictyocoela muelleri]|nr:putative cytosolic Fe-S cluster assembly factor [Dictyocoela muelleri]